MQTDADPNLAYHYDADPDPVINLMRIRILPFHLIRIRNIRNTDCNCEECALPLTWRVSRPPWPGSPSRS
jgi:hypothetical protein